MAIRKIIVELKHTESLEKQAFSTAPVTEKKLNLDSVPKVKGIVFDKSYTPVMLPRLSEKTVKDAANASGENFIQILDPKQSTYIVRADADEKDIDDLASHEAVVGVFSDVEIHSTVLCGNDPPAGNLATVQHLLMVNNLHRVGMDGTDTLIAIVDSGINLTHLTSQGVTINIDATRSWMRDPAITPGNAPVAHGTMTAFDAAIVATNATFLDIQLLPSSPISLATLLSDALNAYAHLCNVMSAPLPPGENRSLIVNNSWGMYNPSGDLPVGSAGNYSDNPNHPFNQIVSTLEQLGADIVFSAGNCGADCPSGRCNGITQNTIYGANGHPSVLTVAGVDVNKNRVGYSSIGPARLSQSKPDLCGYTHFHGSGVYPIDSGTSAAAPVVAGVIAAIRSLRPYIPGNPARTPQAIRHLLRCTAQDRGVYGFDFQYGHGVVSCAAIYRLFFPPKFVPICLRAPLLCVPRPGDLDICKKFPKVCTPYEYFSPEQPGTNIKIDDSSNLSPLEEIDIVDLLETVWKAGFYDARQGLYSRHDNLSENESAGDCSCKKNGSS